MRKRLETILIILVWSSVLVLTPLAAFAQEVPEDLQHKPLDPDILIQFLEKIGYKKYKLIEAEGEKVILYMVQKPNSQEIFRFLILPIPEGRMLKIECHGLADVPSDRKRFALLLEKLNELNGMRTIGKYCLDPKRKKVRFFYYMTASGGICFADFRRTILMIENFIFNDIEAIRKLG